LLPAIFILKARLNDRVEKNLPTLSMRETSVDNRQSREIGRRDFLLGLGAASGYAILPSFLTGCGSGGSTSTSTTSSDSSAPIKLGAGSYGTLERPRNAPYSLNLVNPAGVTIATYGQDDHRLINAPQSGIAAQDGSFWIVDPGNRQILHLDSKLALIGKINSVAGVQFSQPVSIAQLSDQRLVVSDKGVGRICIFNPNGSGSWYGTAVETQVSSGWRPNWPNETNSNLLDNPKSVEILSNDNILVLDTAAKRIVQFSSGGSAIKSYYLGGNPTDMTVSTDDTVYIADSSSKKVSHFKLIEFPKVSALAIPSGTTPYSLVWRANSSAALNNLIINAIS
jgi:hypothetical protein